MQSSGSDHQLLTELTEPPSEPPPPSSKNYKPQKKLTSHQLKFGKRETLWPQEKTKSCGKAIRENEVVQNHSSLDGFLFPWSDTRTKKNQKKNQKKIKKKTKELFFLVVFPIRLVVLDDTKMNRILFLFVVGLWMAQLGLSSPGDRDPNYRRCIFRCNKKICQSPEQEQKERLKETQTIFEEWLGWGCMDECKYQCMHQAREAREKRGTTHASISW